MSFRGLRRRLAQVFGLGISLGFLSIAGDLRADTFGGLTAGAGSTAAGLAPLATPVGEFACGASCTLQKGYQTTVFQLQYVQRKSQRLADAWNQGYRAADSDVQGEIAGFCTDQDLQTTDSSVVRGGQGAAICYRNAQLFNAALIQRYQESLKEIASNQAALVARNADGTVIEGPPTAFTGIGKAVTPITVPTLSEVKKAFIDSIRANKGVLQLTSQSLNQAWSEAIYIGGNPKNKKLSFDGRAAVISKVAAGTGADAQKTGQMINRNADGSIVTDAKLQKSADRIENASAQELAGSAAWGKSTPMTEVRAESMLKGKAKKTEDSIQYGAFMETRAGLTDAYSGQIKKDAAKAAVADSDAKDGARKPSSTGATASRTSAPSRAGLSTVPSASDVSVDANTWSKPTITTTFPNGKPGSSYGEYGEEDQPAPNPADPTNYSVHQQNLDHVLSEDALKEYEGSWAKPAH